MYTLCTSLVGALYRPCTAPCTRSVHAMLTGCTRLYRPCPALYWPCTSLRPHSKLRVQGSRFKVRGSAPPAICHPPSSVAALPRWALCGQRRLWVALGCGRLEFHLQAVGDLEPVWMDFLADSGAEAGWHGVGMATEAPYRLRRVSTGPPPTGPSASRTGQSIQTGPTQRMNRTPKVHDRAII